MFGFLRLYVVSLIFFFFFFFFLSYYQSFVQLQGFPSSVTPDYVPFQIWDSLQVKV